jgi:hypothetical protein
MFKIRSIIRSSAFRPFVAIIVMTVYFLGYTPTIAFDFVGIYIALLVCACILFMPLPTSWEALKTRRALGLAVALLILIAIAFVTTSPMLHAAAYRDLIGKETKAELSASLPPLKLDSAPLVSADMAMRVAEKTLADKPALGSVVQLGPMTKQIVRGELVWVSFLQHRGFFQWFSESTTPGYVKVSAHDPSRVELVTTLGGADLHLKYLTSSYAGSNVERHLWLHGLAFTGIADLSEELDDDGRPFYVATLYDHTVGLSGANAVGIATVDAQTGEIRRYTMQDVPAWVDRIQPMDFIIEQVNDRGEYVHGWLNPSGQDKLKVSSIDVVYDAGGRADYYVGLTSVSRDNGLVGFLLVDSRTKAVRRFDVAGLTESVAESAARNVYPEKGYLATSALPFLINNEPTYALAMRDRETGIGRAFALVSLRHYGVVAVADTLQATERLYQSKLSQNRVAVDSSSAVVLERFDGIVERIASESRNGSTLYYLTLAKTANGLIFVGSSDISEEIVLTRPGDHVSLSASKGQTRVVNLSMFRNLDMADTLAK